jgi:hypothetical protein
VRIIRRPKFELRDAGDVMSCFHWPRPPVDPIGMGCCPLTTRRESLSANFGPSTCREARRAKRPHSAICSSLSQRLRWIVFDIGFLSQGSMVVSP